MLGMPCHAKLGEKRQERLLACFVGCMTARAAADLLGIHRNNAALTCHRLRQIIAHECHPGSAQPSNQCRPPHPPLLQVFCIASRFNA